MARKKSLKTKEVEKLLCIFCYKLVRNYDSNASKENGEDETIPSNSNVSISNKMEICDQFFNQLHHPPLSVKSKKKTTQESANASIVEEEEDEKNKKGDSDIKANAENIAISWNHLKSGICIDCFYAVDTYARLFGEVEKMQRRLRWQLDRLYKVMKCAGTIPSRVQDFQHNLNESKDGESIKDFRQKVFRTCRQRLKTLNINVDGLGWTAKTKGQSENADVDTSILNNSKLDLNSSSFVTALSTPIPTTKSTSVKRKSKGKLLEGSPIKRTATQRDPIFLPANDLTTIFKCSKCSSTFPSLHSLTNHAKAEHWILKEEPGNSSDTDEEPMVVECTVEIKCGSKDEMRNLQKCIGKKVTGSPTSDSSGTFSFSSADTEVRKNYPKLKKIYQKLLSHNPENDEEEEALKLAEKSSRQKIPSPPKKKKREKMNTKPKTTSNSNEHDAICDKCGEVFTGTSLLQAEAQLFRHLSANQRHYGEASWKYTCKICNKIFPKEITLTNHISKIHGNEKKKAAIQKKNFSCSHCQKKFGKKENLIKHFENAHKEKIQVLEVRRKKKKQMKVDKFEGGKLEDESMMWEDCDGDDADISVGDIGEHFEAVVVKHKEG